MAAMAVVARDHDRFAGFIVRIDDRSERFHPNHRMVSEMHQCACRVRLNCVEADLQRRELAARVVWILDDLDTRVVRNCGAHAISMRAENNHQPWHYREHRPGYVLDESSVTDLQERLGIAHPARLTGRQYDSIETLRHRGLLRAFEVAETDAERELVALFGPALAYYFSDDRDCDFLGSLATDRDTGRRVNVGETLFGDTALADSI